MCKVKNIVSVFIVAQYLTACAPAITVDLAVSPAKKASASIKSLTDQTNPNPQSCNLPCQLQIDRNSKYEVSISSDGYYPATVTFDHTAALFTSSALYPREHHVPLVIPLIENKTSQ